MANSIFDAHAQSGALLALNFEPRVRGSRRAWLGPFFMDMAAAAEAMGQPDAA